MSRRFGKPLRSSIRKALARVRTTCTCKHSSRTIVSCFMLSVTFTSLPCVRCSLLPAPARNGYDYDPHAWLKRLALAKRAARRPASQPGQASQGSGTPGEPGSQQPAVPAEGGPGSGRAGRPIPLLGHLLSLLVSILHLYFVLISELEYVINLLEIIFWSFILSPSYLEIFFIYPTEFILLDLLGALLL